MRQDIMLEVSHSLVNFINFNLKEEVGVKKIALNRIE